MLGGVRPGGGGGIGGGVPEVAAPWVYVCFNGLFQVCEQLLSACIKKLVDGMLVYGDLGEVVRVGSPGAPEGPCRRGE